MKAYGAGIYLLEKYDPQKIPILFVHGAEGSPQNWVYFLIRLDRTRYQPWFFYYPSGIRMPLATKLLYENLIDLWKQYQFSHLCITAHSMGGLITRSLVTKYNFKKHNDFIKLYVTLATPWSGFESADQSQQLSIRHLPVWQDVGPKSSFIRRTLRAPLPDNISYYLFYGKADTVSKGRALDQRAYNSAKGKFGFDYDHDTILSAKEVFLKYNQILRNEFPPNR